MDPDLRGGKTIELFLTGIRQKLRSEKMEQSAIKKERKGIPLVRETTMYNTSGMLPKSAHAKPKGCSPFDILKHMKESN